MKVIVLSKNWIPVRSKAIPIDKRAPRRLPFKMSSGLTKRIAIDSKSP